MKKLDALATFFEPMIEAATSILGVTLISWCIFLSGCLFSSKCIWGPRYVHMWYEIVVDILFGFLACILVPVIVVGIPKLLGYLKPPCTSS